jgi:hypothetical protein
MGLLKPHGGTGPQGGGEPLRSEFMATKNTISLSAFVSMRCAYRRAGDMHARAIFFVIFVANPV